MIFLLAQWKIFLGMGIAGIILITLHNLDISRIEAKQKEAIAAQIQYDLRQCAAEKQITANSEQSYETQISNLNADLERLRNAPAKLVYVVKPSNQRNAANQPNKSGNGDGVDSGRLYTYSGECEKDRISVNVLQDFIKQVWKANGQ